MRIGIIGGNGGMGSLFFGVFARAGHEVLISGRKTPEVTDEIVATCDIVMVSVPIHATVPLIEAIAPSLTPGQVLCDLTSLKVAPVRAMLASPAKVIGLHPMFGPSAPTIAGQTVVLTPARCDDHVVEFFTNLLQREGAQVTITTPQHHDAMMAIVQGLTHFVTLTVAETVRRLGIPPKETLPFMSPVYRIEMGMVGRLLSQDPVLYYDILHGNPQVPNVLSTYLDAACSLQRGITTRDAQEFVDTFRSDAAFFGDYCARAMRETDQIIAGMVRG
ncbi:MAG: prephenate dehydrogenase/arogenate dehydrogenase family protein [Methanomicrobiales archaeon]|jgi:prephenate dehydrogenase|nr:prephenate dehydrogenase/arogenate dehydrogenase family protein [Methanomicrobiales archaeon]